MTHDNAETIDRFYRAFQARDGDAMAACYAPDAHFTDPVFPDLRGEEPGAMWKMLCARATDLRIEHRAVSADETRGAAHWEAWYTFATGRKVHNVIEASFRFEDGKIVRHVDDFDFGRWSRQAIGIPAVLLGWTGLLQRKVRRTADGQLRAFLARNR